MSSGSQTDAPIAAALADTMACSPAAGMRSQTLHRRAFTKCAGARDLYQPRGVLFLQAALRLARP